MIVGDSSKENEMARTFSRRKSVHALHGHRPQLVERLAGRDEHGEVGVEALPHLGVELAADGRKRDLRRPAHEHAETLLLGRLHESVFLFPGDDLEGNL